MNGTSLCLNVDIKENLDYPEGGTEAPTVGISRDTDEDFIGINNI